MPKTSSLALATAVAAILLPASVSAEDDDSLPTLGQPEDTDQPEDTTEPKPDPKAEARALVKRAFEHVYEGEHALALEKFERAHELYPSPKILLNIGTTLKKLGRYAESAAIYERYLSHPETDKAREKEVKRELADVEARIGRLQITINVDGAQVLVDGKKVTLDGDSSVRVDPGSHSIVAQKDGYQPRTVSAFDVKARETRRVRLGLVSLDDVARERAREQAQAFEQGQAAAISAIRSQRIETRRRPGASAGIAVAVDEPAASALVGLSYGVSDRLDIEANAVLGGEVGAYLGARGFIMTDRFRLSVSAGIPAFFIDGVDPGVRAGVGAGALITDHFGLTLDIGLEHYFSLPDTLDSTLLVPRLVFEARL